MEPSNNKRSKLVNIMLLIAIVVLCNKSAYTNEQIKVNINSQPKTTSILFVFCSHFFPKTKHGFSFLSTSYQCNITLG